MLAEAEERPLLEAGFDCLYNWKIFHLLNSVARHEQVIQNLDGMIEWEFMEFPADKAHMHFTSNHDENSWNGSAIERLGNILEPAIVLSFTLPGMPLIYSGQEAGLWKRLSFFDKDLIEWKEDKLGPLFTRLNQLKQHQPALWNAEYGGSIRRIMHEESRDVMTFVREKNGSRVIVCINFSSDFKRFKLSHYAYQGMYEDYFSNHQVSLALDAGITLKPFEYKIFVK
jgi:1,4-alpha-glucan branching enzyme